MVFLPDYVLIMTSGENMALYAAANIALAVKNFGGRGYAALGGLILNRRGAPDEEEKTRQLAREFDTEILGILDWSETVQQAENLGRCVLDAFPDSAAAAQYRNLAQAILTRCPEPQEAP